MLSTRNLNRQVSGNLLSRKLVSSLRAVNQTALKRFTSANVKYKCLSLDKNPCTGSVA